ncbi:hypothetical protein BKA70DRAFT_1499437 [Coprinopsis sp. MPI-PUGE-AT-0042]|nr:hypothetical protein BKA70DRAFT_1499437 [Coprinopsis sp. MPI-PUGE-AT-0042]
MPSDPMRRLVTGRVPLPDRHGIIARLAYRSVAIGTPELNIRAFLSRTLPQKGNGPGKIVEWEQFLGITMWGRTVQLKAIDSCLCIRGFPATWWGEYSLPKDKVKRLRCVLTRHQLGDLEMRPFKGETYACGPHIYSRDMVSQMGLASLSLAIRELNCSPCLGHVGYVDPRDGTVAHPALNASTEPPTAYLPTFLPFTSMNRTSISC